MNAIGKLVALCVVLVTACGDDERLLLFEPEGLQPARLEFFGDAPRVSVPATAALGEPFVIDIQTYGGGCIEPGPTPVKLVGGRLEVRPLDDFPRDDALCTADIRLNDHSVTYSVDADMTLEIDVLGVSVTDSGREDLTVTRTIVIGAGSG